VGDGKLARRRTMKTRRREWTFAAILVLVMGCSVQGDGVAETRATSTVEVEIEEAAGDEVQEEVELGEGGGEEQTALDVAKERVLGALGDRWPENERRAWVVDGPQGVVFVRAAIEGAYPGTGVAALVYDPETERTYGRRGEHGIARLVQERGWLQESRLADRELIQVVHQAQFDGILIIAEPVVEPLEGGGVRVVLPSLTMRGDPNITYGVELREEGEEVVERLD
jgi:hypothetical protein